MREKKYELNLYPFTDGDAMARHTERMHARGWRLEKVSAWGWTYRRGEPERVRYAVTYFPAASVYDARPTEGQRTYAEYCAAAGWEFVDAYGPVQFFRSRAEKPIPIETDEREKLRAVHRSMLKTHVLSYGLLTCSMLLNLLPRWDRFQYNALSMVRDGAAVWLTGLLLVLLFFLLVMLGDYFLWYLRSRWSVARGGACAKSHWRFHLGVTYGVFIAAAVGMTGYFASLTGEPGGAVWAGLLIFGGALAVVAAEYAILTRAKEAGWDRGAVRTACLLAAVALALAYCGGAALLLPFLTDAHREDGHVTEPYTYLSAAGDEREITLYQDPLPLTLEDLGVAAPPEAVPYTCRADRDRSPLAWGGEYRQEGAVIRAERKLPPELGYSVTVFRWQWLRDLCCDTLLERYQAAVFNPYIQVDEPAWGAERVYRRGAEYFLLYPDRAVTLWTRSWDAALTEEQIAVIVEKLTA